MPKDFLLVGSQTDSAWVTALREALRPRGELDLATEFDAVSKMRKNVYKLVIIDASHLASEEEIVTLLHRNNPDVPLVVASASPAWERARLALVAGAVDYIKKSLDENTLSATFDDILARLKTN
jgi:DNA-binding NtrC family response regulator